MKSHIKLLATAIAALAVGTLTSFAQIASDNGSNYSGGWGDGSNGGSGFAPWSISSNAGTGFAGNFVGNSTDAGITGMIDPSFGLFANPNGSGAFVNADRAFSAALGVGQTFSFQWGINFDSGADGNKGFNLYSGGVGATEIVNINNAGSSTITFNGDDAFTAYGTTAMTWSFTLTDASTLSVSATARDGGAPFSTTVAVSAAPDSFRFYASQMQSGDEAQPYFNNLTVVPEPSTYALLGLGAASVLWRIRRRKVS